MRAGNDQGGTLVRCDRCGHAVACPVSTPSASGSAIPPILKTAVIAGLVVALAVMGWAAFEAIEATPDLRTDALSPAESRQRELLKLNLDRPGDADLMKLYGDLNARHFGGRLPPMPIVWEPRLAEVGDLAQHAFTLEGMFGHIGQRTAILMNVSLRDDPAALRRALCHEMVHVALYESGDRGTNHGPAFRSELERLAKERAFEGIVASEQERQALRAWLDAESGRLDEQGRVLQREADALKDERAAVEEDFARANAMSSEGRPISGAAVQDLAARKQAYNDRVDEAAALSERAHADVAVFNRQVERYNLMLLYPDGLDDGERMVTRAR